MTLTELKQVQLYRQHITNKTDKLTAARDLNGFQSQFLINAYNALRIRCCDELTPDTFGEGLVKNWTIRGTVHVFAESDLPLYKYESGCDDGHYHSHDWDTQRMYGECKIPPDRLEYLSRMIVDMVANGITEREAIKIECHNAGMTEAEGGFVFDQWGGLMRGLCERGFLCYRVREKKEFMICPPFTPMNDDEAMMEQWRRYFTNYAPATVRDTAYYFGCTQTKVKEMMKKLPLNEIEISGVKYYYLEELKSDYPNIPNCVLLAGFDPLMLGYQKKDGLYLAENHIRGIFNLAGIVMPPILLDGSVIGRWRKKNTKMTFEIFSDVIVGEWYKKHIVSEMELIFSDIRKTEWTII